MELRHLRYFVVVAEAENVSRAAGQVHISQPALSLQIHDLEGELGVALFERAGRSLRLMGPGEDLLAHARKVLNEAAMFRERARALHRGDAGVLHVGATPQSLQRLFPAALSRFRRILPGRALRSRPQGRSAPGIHGLPAGAVEAGCGVAILPATVALRRGGFTTQRLVQDGKPFEVYLAVHWSPQRLLPPYAGRFAEQGNRIWTLAVSYRVCSRGAAEVAKSSCRGDRQSLPRT
jgi:DNA-binding transcriptional LysR family regulator